ncbi:MAG: membrane protein insertase YidC [Prevotellaceae bacterium]|jgi:YidC/Oxa1 family membrane protein insertase|nr:membrane protein insertase YidC [Prevotellaceae bacterium]
MNKNTVSAIVLIAAIFITFTWYNSKDIEEQRKLQFQRDSIAQTELSYQQREQRLRDSIAVLQQSSQTPADVQSAYTASLGAVLDSASIGDEQFYTLENNLLSLTFTNKGARVYAATIKNYNTYDSLPIMLFGGEGNDFALQFFTTQQLSTSAFFFHPVDMPAHTSLNETDSTARLVMRLPIAENAYIDYTYTLRYDSYKLKLDITLSGLDKQIPQNATNLDLHWTANMRRQEKDYVNESNYSTVAYKYPGESSVNELKTRSESDHEKLSTKVAWVAFKDQFFSAILVAPENFTQTDISFKNYPETHPDRLLMHCDASMQLAYNNRSEQTIPLEFYFTTNQYNTLKSHGHDLEKLVSLGWWIMGYINRWFIIPVFDFLDSFISNYGIIILILTLLIKIILLPLTHRSHVSTAKMKVLQPEISKINEKYPKREDAMKKQQEVMALYKKTGVNMMGGCLPMLLQMPILIAMFNFFPASFELRQKGFLWAQDLSSYDSILDLPFKIPFYGDHISLFVLLMAVSLFFYSRATLSQTASTNQMPGMKFMQLYFMPVFMLMMFNSYSSGLSYYFMLSNFITIGQTWMIRKWFVNEKELLQKMKARAAQPVKKSKFQQRLEEASRVQQQRNKQTRKK